MTTARSEGRRVRLVACPGGPWLVRGADEVVDSDGQTHVVRRPVVAICRCETSQRMPWCDGTHKVLPEDRTPD